MTENLEDNSRIATIWRSYELKLMTIPNWKLHSFHLWKVWLIVDLKKYCWKKFELYVRRHAMITKLMFFSLAEANRWKYWNGQDDSSRSFKIGCVHGIRHWVQRINILNVSNPHMWQRHVPILFKESSSYSIGVVQEHEIHTSTSSWFK